ncbi:MAG TPA: metallophosphoesterase [Chitinophagaceae bacterium]
MTVRSGVPKWLLASICFLLALLALLAPIWPGTSVVVHLGGLLLWIAVIEIFHGFRRSLGTERKSAWYSGGFSLLLGVLLINAQLLLANALFIFIIVILVIEVFRFLYKYLRTAGNSTRRWQDLAATAIGIILLLVLFVFKEKGLPWTLSLVTSLRCFGRGISILAARTGVMEDVNVDVVRDMGLGDNQRILALAEKIENEEDAKAPYDRKWIIVLLLMLFFIHLGRMGVDRSFLGILSPLVATIGDAVIALVIAYVIIGSGRSIIKEGTSWADKKLWVWVERDPTKKRKWWSLTGVTETWLTRRLRNTIRFRKASYSIPTAIRTGLKIGLPWSALLAAIMPVLGMSWYFDTENWASGMWDHWAASRTNTWRMAITSASGEGTGANAFQLHPEGVTDTADFSFVVIGDPGEGDASQLILKDQILSVTNQPDVKFVVISSDVVYPSGSLKDYEKKFWMPFKGVTKPVYAIPGNHDWYDALEGFTATFFEPEAAQIAMEARIKKDLHISSTNKNKIKNMIGATAKLREEYNVPTGFQKAPYFQVNAGNFVFITIETGVEREIDTLQATWLRNVLEASKGKFVMVLLGHPFYAIGEYQGKMNPAFERLHQLLKEYKVPLVMAGDTHDLEYYIEAPKNNNEQVMHHFVNGGGGAYLSIGAAMAKPEAIVTKEYAFYPSKDPLVKKIETNTSWYKYPAWLWTDRLGGWPFSAEWLSAMFDYNVAPYFQSFMEIKVEQSQKRIRLIPYSNNGRLKWSDITSTAGARPINASPNDLAEWIINFQ